MFFRVVNIPMTRDIIIGYTGTRTDNETIYDVPEVDLSRVHRHVRSSTSTRRPGRTARRRRLVRNTVRDQKKPKWLTSAVKT